MELSSSSGFSLDHYFDIVSQTEVTPLSGRVVRVVGLLIESAGPHARVGEVCEVAGAPGDPPLAVEVVGFQDGHLLSVPLGDTSGIRPGARVSFVIEGQRLTGIVNRVTKRATVLVEDPKGERYSDGKHYAKFYIPISWLEPVAV